jgi:hypothetical protein
MAMIRTQIYLPADLDRRLRGEARRRKISKAQLIREKLEGLPGVTYPDLDSPESKAFMKMLREVRERAGYGPGTGWKFDREELYAERLDGIRPDRHERPRQRRRSS